jgi:hypothetical protein
VPPPVPANLTFQPCGSMSPLPEMLGIDAAGEAVLLSSAIEHGATVHLAALPAGQVVRSIELQDDSAVLTPDRQHVITASSLIDLRSGVAQPLAPWANSDVLALSPAGDFAVAVEERPPTEPSAIDAVGTADGVRRQICALFGRPIAATVSADGTRVFVLTVDGLDNHLSVEIRHIADGSLEAGIGPLAESDVDPSAETPLISNVGDYLLVRTGTPGYIVLKVSTTLMIWSTTDRQAQLSPVEGFVASRDENAAPWIEWDFLTQARSGQRPASDPAATISLYPGAFAPTLAYTPDGAEAVLVSSSALWLSTTNPSPTRLPFVGTGWGGRGAFVASDEIVSVELVGSGFEVGVRKRRLPGGEVLGEVITTESQSEWDGDIEQSPDGRLLAVALPGSVRLLRAGDLSEVGLNPNAGGRVSWAPSGSAYITTPDVHYRDPGRPLLEARHTVELWALDGGLTATYQLPFIPTFATFTSDGRAVVATGRDGVVGTNSTTSVINWSGPTQSAVIDVATGRASPLEVTPIATDANRNFATDLFSVERLADGANLATLNLPPTEPVSGPDDLQAWLVAGVDRRDRSFHPPVFSPDASLVTGFAPTQLVLYSTATGARVQTIFLTSTGAGMLAFSPDGRQIAANQWGRDGATQFWCATP